MMPRIPDYITPAQARRFAEHVVGFLNDKEITEDPLQVDEVERVELSAGRALVVTKAVQSVPNYWGDHEASIAPEHFHTTNNDTERTLPWIEELGIDPNTTMRMTLHGPYLQVEGFVTAGAGEWPDARLLRHTERHSGYQKYTIDIPIIENGDSK
ncbi:hypothetical protein SEA_LUCKYBARNES_20 [Brevibacterium phage LuckyBarnes]|uniref:Uncharacterized protein n=1 Tax=Brevibacterium phage LuckyBarnes TaxID=2027888 RepID=A0A249XNS4_9CAUD|nr:hypothetical protein HOS02_gp20 [Brevibacterium phage LuckyBarnes]ASZ73388.1 hypothetical protein SEA_LUCKYBARNES_20 [Brevibacterium phage LuckyBarnes]